MKAVCTRREVILLPAMIVGLVVLAPLKEMLRLIEMAQRGAHLIVQKSFPKPEMVLIDLSLPDSPNSDANPEIGIQALRTLIYSKQAPNIMVHSTQFKCSIEKGKRGKDKG